MTDMLFDPPFGRKLDLDDTDRVRFEPDSTTPFKGRYLGQMRLPFPDPFSVYRRRAVALRFVVGNDKLHYNRDDGNRLTLDFSADPDVMRAFNEAHDRYPIRVFLVEGSRLFYKGIYMLVTIDRRVQKWHFRRVSAEWQVRYADLDTWLARWQKEIPRPIKRPSEWDDYRGRPKKRIVWRKSIDHPNYLFHC